MDHPRVIFYKIKVLLPTIKDKDFTKILLDFLLKKACFPGMRIIIKSYNMKASAPMGSGAK